MKAIPLLIAVAIVLPQVAGAQPMAWDSSRAVFLAAGGLGGLVPQEPHARTVSVAQVVSTALGAGVALGAVISSSDPPRPPCAPCDRSGVPAFDRWSIHTVRRSWARAGDATIIAMAAGSMIDLGQRDGAGRHVVAALEALAWTQATTQVVKGIVDRLRPVMYTEEAPQAAAKASSQGSFPSGHASAAFSLATSYFLSCRDLSGKKRWWVFGVAAFAGASRIVAAKHFLTDVLAGAAIGTGTALLVYEVRF